MIWPKLRQISLILICLLCGWKLVARHKGIEVIDTSWTSSNGTLAWILFIAIIGAAYEMSEMTARYATSTNRLNDPRKKLIWLAAIAITIKTGGIYDYATYKLQWLNIAQGGSPWAPLSAGENAYGPTHGLFTYFYLLHEMAPKLIFTASILCLWGWFDRIYRDHQYLNFLCFFGIFTSTVTFAYGFMDAIPSVATVASIALASKKAYSKSALALTIGAASKFYPALLVPLFIFQFYLSSGKKYAIRFAFWIFGFFAATAILSYLAWGSDILAPLRFASTRTASFLTIWRFLPSSLLSRYGALALVTMYVSCLIFIVLRSSEARRYFKLGEWCAATLCLIFSTFYLGHQQFYLVLILMVPILADGAKVSLEMNKSSGRQLENAILGPCLIAGWLSLIQFSFIIYNEFKSPIVGPIYNLISIMNPIMLALAAMAILCRHCRSPVNP